MYLSWDHFFNEYFSLIEENINQNKLQEWFDEIENKNESIRNRC